MLDDVDRAIIRATEAGLPLAVRPYAEVARAVGVSEADVLARMARMMEEGVIRRIGAVPNHYALGLTHNAMTVWDVADAHVSRLGRLVGGLEFVTHCYHRPRRPPVWPYNLFAMVHDRAAEGIARKIETIATLLGEHARAREVLLSRRILKKTGFRASA
jgi:DNA-binding Lrp family transcriptional regulator